MRKTIFLFALTFLLCDMSYGQMQNCFEAFSPSSPSLTNLAPPPNLASPEPNPDDASYLDSHAGESWVYKVRFHVIKDGVGFRSTEITEEIIMNVIRDLNLNFNQFRIFWKYGGTEENWGNTLTGNQNIGNIYDTFEPMFSDDAFDIFILDGNLENGDGVEAPGYSLIGGRMAFFSYEGITSVRVPSHEIGHSFYLRHVYRNCCDPEVPSASENVIRLVTGPGYNANGIGDSVHDTPAYRAWTLSEYNSSGVYEGSDIDFNVLLNVNDPNRKYKTEHPKINNLLNTHSGPDLSMGYFFTPGQGKRMRWAIATDYDNFYYGYSPALVDYSELYKPFEQTSIAGSYIVSVTDTGNGSAIVCRPWVGKHRWQKGFDYVFQDGSGQPFDTAVPNDLKEIIGGTGDYNVKVLQYDPVIKLNVQIICTRGVICTEEEYIGGILFNVEVLGSMNLTVKELSAIQARDPDLYNSILEKYYNILKRYTASGAQTEQIIYKP